MDKYLGKRLEGRYQIQELIGMGGMSNVYKAYDEIDARTVAVKILRDEFLDNTEFLRRFKNESKAIAVLSHPNIVRVFDVSFTNQVHSIVMEYIDGITLKDYIERQGVLNWKESLHFTLQILRALQHAHDKGIVHRDIKPQNIMLLENGEIKVTDFGIARFARSEVKTITDRAIGSVHYISPEQAMGGNTDEKSDIYSVGVMLFEMLTGRLPFEADSAVSVAIKQIQTQAVRPRSLNPEIPEGLEEITVRAMQKEAGRRYQSASEMIADIEKFKRDPSIHFAYQYAEAEPKKGGKGLMRRGRQKGAQQEAPEEEQGRVRRRRTPYIPILTGVTLAFVLASLGFISLMLYWNNPFTQTEEDELPNFVGLKIDTAVSQYPDFVIVEVERNFNADFGSGVIYEQKPRPGTRVKVGSEVRVTVSSGKQIVALPNFTNKEANQVYAKLKELGLDYKVQRVFHSEIAQGYVVYTEPGQNTELPSGSTVTLYVSQGPEEKLVSVPNLDGLLLEDARAELERYNLVLGSVSEESSDRPAGVIVGQSPSAGGWQLEGTTVNVVVSREGKTSYAIPVPMPENMNRTVRVQVRQDETWVIDDYLNPAETGVWRPVFTGDEKDGEVQIRIYVDERLYHEYFLDFSTGNRTAGRDRSDAEEFQE